MKEAYEEIKRALQHGDNYVSTETLKMALEALRIVKEQADSVDRSLRKSL